LNVNTQKLFCFGHRGACGHEPENTLRSVRRALELGAHGVEVDVHLADGQLMVIHDDTLQRTTNGVGRIAEKTFDYLRSLDAGLGEHIPTLAEVLDTVNHRAVINVELKGPGAAVPVVTLIDEYVHKHGWRYEDFLLSSFDHEQIREAKLLQPQIRIAPLIDKVPRGQAKFAQQMSAWSVNISRRCVTRTLVEDAHFRGLKVFVFTVNEPKDITRMKSLGVDGVVSDFPERVVNIC
jgi:glycerophosphoryl diester phosphodiesterase